MGLRLHFAVYGLRFAVKGFRIPGGFFARNIRELVDSQWGDRSEVKCVYVENENSTRYPQHFSLSSG